MSNLSDKELDRLSREAAERYEPEVDASSWNKLEQLLDRDLADKPPTPPPVFSKRPIIYGLILLTLAGTSYFLLKTNNYRNHSTQNNSSATVTSKPGDKQNNASSQNNPSASADENVAGKKSASATPGSDNAARENANNADASNSSTRKSQADDNTSAQKDHAVAGSENNNKGKDKTQADIARLNNKTLLSNNSNRKNKSANDIVAPNSVSNQLNIAGNNKNIRDKNNRKNNKHINRPGQTQQGSLTNADLSAVDQHQSLANNNNEEESGPRSAILPGLSANSHSFDINDSALRSITSNNTNQPAKQNEALHINNSLKLGVMFAPDYTNVRSASNNKFSTNVGITIGYEFAKRWSINTGFIYTVKKYGINKNDFHGPSTSWPPPYPSWDIESINGNCHMIEIPLTLRYDFPINKNTLFFVNGGLSSYFMKQESYTFNIKDNASGNRWPSEHAYNNHEKYWFSIANFSLGIEKNIGKHLSIQAEPFIKVPLSGVGLGELQLNSYGVSFSLRYAPVLKKSRH